MIHHRPMILSALLGCLLAAATPAAAQSTDNARSAEDILHDFDNVRMPSMSNGNSPEAVAEFRRRIEEGCLRQAALALELYVAHPDHPRLDDVLDTRWAVMTNALDKSAEVLTDVETVIADCKREDVLNAAHLAAGWAALKLPKLDPKKREALVEKAVETNPDHDRSPLLLMRLALSYTPDPKHIKAILTRVEKQWPNPRWGQHELAILKRGVGLVGKTVDCEFVDLASGEPVSLTDSDAPFTIVQLHSGYGDQKEAVTALARVGKQIPDVRLLTVFVQGAGGSKVTALSWSKKLGITWPIHRDSRDSRATSFEQIKTPSDPWAKYQRLQFLLLDGDGKLIAWSQSPDTLARRIKALRARSF